MSSGKVVVDQVGMGDKLAHRVRQGCQNGQMPVQYTKIHLKGVTLYVPSAEIDGRTVVTSGKWLKTATLYDEELVEGASVNDPDLFIAELKNTGIKVDLFTFAQRLPDITARYNYHTEWENAAALPITTFSAWWKERTEYSIRKGVNRAKKLGLLVRVTDFSDELVEGIRRIYSENPVRQGKAFWHHGKTFQVLKDELGTYVERSVFIGAYYQDELIGSMKMTYVGPTASIMQIFSTRKHFDKRPNNALIAKAVEVCELEGKSHLIYGDFVYYDPNSRLTEFKRRNGFEPVPLPRYYIPLTLKGKAALQLGLHRGLAARIPKAAYGKLLKIRSYWYGHKLDTPEEHFSRI